MNVEDAQQYRDALIRQRDELLLDLQKHGQLPQERIDSEDRDPADQANAAMARDLDQRIAGGEDRLLDKIETALQRLDQGAYGKCEQCQGSISKERLLAKPSVSLCIDCQRAKEEQA